ncbi:MAG: hypothetical protein H6P98_2864, partial [Candidatus Aminicenantes bacterium]|nr:hypothetical protein [Candidatus Aminicenantes bacterium]
MSMSKRRHLILGSLFFLTAMVGPGFTAETEKLAPLSPLRTDTPPVIDGVLDDPVWALAPSETGFKTWR